MKILAIETSCDETAIALLDISGDRARPDIKLVANALLSQIHLHEKYGGVYPNLAKREHIKNLPILLNQVVEDAKIDEAKLDIDLIAVTAGPGLEPALWTGITFAEELGKKWSKPVMPINHMEGHIYSVLYNTEKNLSLPALALLVSGGHTELVHIKDFGDYEIIGRTLDDAVGEAFDKVARMLELSYPGGPKISMLAGKARSSGRSDNLKFPRPMIHSKDFNFSYSGLKTAVLYKLKELGPLTDETRENVARAFEDAAIEVLVDKTRRALEKLGGEVKSLIVAGGVAANRHLSSEIERLTAQFPELTLHIPEKMLATDNAIMIGIASFIRTTLNSSPRSSTPTSIQADGNLSLTSSQ